MCKWKTCSRTQTHAGMNAILGVILSGGFLAAMEKRWVFSDCEMSNLIDILASQNHAVLSIRMNKYRFIDIPVLQAWDKLYLRQNRRINGVNVHSALKSSLDEVFCAVTGRDMKSCSSFGIHCIQRKLVFWNARSINRSFFTSFEKSKSYERISVWRFLI